MPTIVQMVPRRGERAPRTRSCPPAERQPDLRRPELYANRKLSWLDYNERVLEVAEDRHVPLLERLRFCALYATNLDEFFRLRVAGLRAQVAAGVEARSADGRTPDETLRLVYARVGDLAKRLDRCVTREILPALAKRGVRVTAVGALDDKQRKQLRSRFRDEIFPVLSPVAVPAGAPVPYISSLSLSLGVLVGEPDTGRTVIARVKVPKEMLPRFLDVSRGKRSTGVTLVPLEQVIAAHLRELFPGMEIVDHALFRATRGADFTVSDDTDDLLQAGERDLRERPSSDVVRVEVGARPARPLREWLAQALQVPPGELIEAGALLDQSDLRQIADLPGMADLRFEPFSPVTHHRLCGERRAGDVDLFGTLRAQDVLVHHPYHSFATSVERFVEQAVSDPDVLAIKAIVYRTSDDSPLVPALVRATDRGKQAVCVVELGAHLDERANVQWARALEQAGAHVVYGNPTVTTHAKCILAVRREGGQVRNYVHVGTGEYNPTTARTFTDIGLFTTDEQIGSDIADLFNYLTGVGRPTRYRKVLVAPAHLRAAFLSEVEKTIAERGRAVPARIAVKVNSLADPECIEALYRASRAGVAVDVNVRATCCLRPGVPGISERVRVVSTVGRFVEHARVILFERGEERLAYIGSADLTPRSFDNRIELMVPVEEPTLVAELDDALRRAMADDTDAWELRPDGHWKRRDGKPSRSVQRELARLHTQRTAAALRDT